MQQHRPAPSTARTLTVEEQQSEAGPSTRPDPSASGPAANGVLKLRGGPLKKQRVVWSDETVDNEGMGKKKSKICCIYHKPRAYDESSDESSCSSDEGHDHSHSHPHASGSGSGGQRVRPGPSGSQVEEQDSASSESDGGGGDGRARPARKGKSRPPKANKYDAQPKSDAGSSGLVNGNDAGGK